MCKIFKQVFLSFLGYCLFILPVSAKPVSSFLFPAENKNCLSCHQGLEVPRNSDSAMMQEIFAKGLKLGDPNGCVVCHGGTPSEIKDENRAHSGAPEKSLIKEFTPVPGALQVNENTCGQCHQEHVYNVKRSHMNTDAGKMKAITWSWGIGTENYDHIYGDHDLDDPDGIIPTFGSKDYKKYMKELAKSFPGQFPKSLKQIPDVDLKKIEEMPEQAAFTYLRNCNACHLSGKGYQDRGHFRGMGCSACHSLYSNEGYYEGGDKSLPKDKPGHLMTHSMQGSRKSGLNVNDSSFSGVQVNTCAACHSAGRRIGHAYQGLMAYGHGADRGPFDKDSNPQKANSGYVFKFIKEDVHYNMKDTKGKNSGLLCQDCHLTTSMHGNGNIGATTLATVEVECADCHGTPDKFPWELPLGFGDEFGKPSADKPRGLADAPMDITRKFSKVYDKEGGYLISARGNPFGNVVRRGDKVLVHSANGHDFELTPLKAINQNKEWTNPSQAKTAMVGIPQHMEKLECYACHASWAAQYYGYQYTIDYRKQSVDWLDSAEKVLPDGTTADYNKNMVLQPGAPTSWDYSHVRWENPPLGVNGEGRVTPLVGVIQTIGTVIGLDGKTLLWNKVAKTKDGYSAMELSPLNPHTTTKETRNCADCHGNPAAIGYGIDNGRYGADPDISRYADVRTGEGENVSKFTKVQIHAIKELHGDFMQVLRPDGTQVQTLDSHWPTSMPLTLEQRDALERGNTCVACHQDIPKGSIPIAMLGKIAKIVDISFMSEKAHSKLLRENNILISWAKFLAILTPVVAFPLFFLFIWKRKKK
ncbi:MAG: hypothetical protein RBR53_09770 [Desulforegulaceae bacterium]|nr:hypothetical protein [Desulforegulaceae bacterium]